MKVTRCAVRALLLPTPNIDHRELKHPEAEDPGQCGEPRLGAFPKLVEADQEQRDHQEVNRLGLKDHEGVGEASEKGGQVNRGQEA